ncbi:hypothetical protein QUF58_04445 [Anaerolineales bacterium HSG24]|nr:hypothetical protein [Anaerolineales bacterium HSG24]
MFKIQIKKLALVIGLIFMGLMILPQLTQAQTATCTFTNSSDDYWETSSNWDCDSEQRLPGPTDTAIINGMAVISSTQSIYRLEVSSNGSVHAQGTLNVEEDVIVKTYFYSNAPVNINGDLLVESQGFFWVYDAPLTIGGNATINGGDFEFHHDFLIIDGNVTITEGTFQVNPIIPPSVSGNIIVNNEFNTSVDVNGDLLVEGSFGIDNALLTIKGDTIIVGNFMLQSQTTDISGTLLLDSSDVNFSNVTVNVGELTVNKTIDEDILNSIFVREDFTITSGTVFTQSSEITVNGNLKIEGQFNGDGVNPITVKKDLIIGEDAGNGLYNGNGTQITVDGSLIINGQSSYSNLIPLEAQTDNRGLGENDAWTERFGHNLYIRQNGDYRSDYCTKLYADQDHDISSSNNKGFQFGTLELKAYNKPINLTIDARITVENQFDVDGSSPEKMVNISGNPTIVFSNSKQNSEYITVKGTTVEKNRLIVNSGKNLGGNNDLIEFNNGEAEITGHINLIGRSNDSGASVFLSPDQCSKSAHRITQVSTNESGYFSLEPSSGAIYSYLCVVGPLESYLVGQKENPQGNIGYLSLPIGDLDDRNISVDIDDLKIFSKNFLNREYLLDRADFDKSGLVDIDDLKPFSKSFLRPADMWHTEEQRVGMVNTDNINNPTVYMEVSDAQLPIGEHTTSVIRLEQATNVEAVYFRLSFEPNILRIVDADETEKGIQVQFGSFFDDGNFLVARNQVENGIVELAGALHYPTEPINGDVTIAFIEMVGLMKGISEIKLEELIVIDSNDQSFDYSGHKISIEVLEPFSQDIVLGDVNNDNIINIFDLSVIASKYNTSDSIADLNEDGIVNILDIVLAANNYQP